VRRLALVAVAVLVAAGCSSSKPGEKIVSPTPVTVVGTVPGATKAAPVPKEYAHGDPAAGKKVFLTAGCKACHTLADASATGTIGPNLDDAKPPLGLAVDRVVHGKGQMPPFQSQLSTKQIANVAAYVVKATQG
jgi:mono/diheme cytochrome c family protein